MDYLIEELAGRGFTVVFEPSLENDRPIVLVTVRRGGDSYVARGRDSWKALQRAVFLVPTQEDIFDAINS